LREDLLDDRDTVTWLHLSDLHLCKPKNGADRYRVLKALIEDLHKLRSEEKLHPDLLFVTGDPAYGNLGTGEYSLSSQYDEVHQFLDQVRHVYDPPIPLSRVFLVPGNHDVDRNMVTPALTDWLSDLSRHGAVEDMVQTASKQWRQYLERLHAYRDFLERFSYGHLLQDRERLIYAQPIRVRNVDVAVAGLNTAWSCGRKQETSIWVGGRPQIDRLFPAFENAHVRIALMHHSTRWIHPQESPRLDEQLIDDFDFCLYGHEHRPYLIGIHGGHHRIGAGATYSGPYEEENSYNLARINVAAGEGRVWMRECKSHRWGPKRVLPYTDDHGVWPLGPTLERVAKRFHAAPSAAPELHMRQSAVVCVQRDDEHGLRFLLTRTSKERWLFQKGRVTVTTPKEAAIDAAQREAAAFGKIEERLLTRFQYLRDDDPPIPTAAYIFHVEELKEPPDKRFPTWHNTGQAVAALMEKRQPHEWWPLVSVVREAWERLEGKNAHRV
jgi:predicted MPP superfamily phosphohydrolase